MSTSASSPPVITAVILAGGQGSRMGGSDKGLVTFRGKPLVEHVIDHIAPQAEKLVISANRSIERYQEFGYPVIVDTLPDFPGPLAGILSALEAIESDLLLAVPCDTPLLPDDLVQRLLKALTEQSADIALPFDGERVQSAILLMRRTVTADLRKYLVSGERKVQWWLKRHRTAQADFSGQAASFANLNTLEELALLEQHGGH